MISLVFSLILCINLGYSAPVVPQTNSIQEAASKFFYPGPPQFYVPLVNQQPTWQSNQLPGFSSNSADIAFRQSTGTTTPPAGPGGLISAIPFLPIQINLPDVLQSIIRALQKYFGPNIPFIGNPTIVTPHSIYPIHPDVQVFNPHVIQPQLYTIPILMIPQIHPDVLQSGISDDNDAKH